MALELGQVPIATKYTHTKSASMSTTLGQTPPVPNTFVTGLVYTLEFGSGLVITATVAADLSTINFAATPAVADAVPPGTNYCGWQTSANGTNRFPFLFGTWTSVTR